MWMAESLLVLRTDFITFQTTKKKIIHTQKLDPKHHPEEIPELVTKLARFCQELVGSDISYSCIRLPQDFYTSLDARHIDEVIELTGKRKQGTRPNTLEASGIFTAFTTNPVVRLILSDSNWHYHKCQMHYCCHFHTLDLKESRDVKMLEKRQNILS